MSEKPILFSGPMVRAILGGAKTQTRRYYTSDTNLTNEELSKLKGRYAVGDLLWVRESIRRCGEPIGEERWCSSVFIADGAPTKADCWPWKNKALPSIHMPYGLSRITLRVTAARVERLQEISEEDARAEGVTTDAIQGTVNGEPATLHPMTHRQAFVWLWDTINGKRCPWRENPWVWRYEFERCA